MHSGFGHVSFFYSQERGIQMMDFRKVLFRAVICGSLMMAGGTVFSGHDVYAADKTAIQGTVYASPMPVIEEEKPAEPDIRGKTRAILAGLDRKRSSPVGENGVIKGNIYIPKDTKIDLVLQDALASKGNKAGDVFRLKAKENTLINGVVVIPKDTEVSGVVLKAVRNGAFGRAGHLEINIPSIKTVNNIEIPLDGYVKDHGKDDNGAAVVGAMVTLVGGLFMKGENIYFNPGQVFCVSVQKDTDLMATPENLEEVMARPLNQPQGNNIVVTTEN